MKALLASYLSVMVVFVVIGIAGCEKRADESQVAESTEQTKCPVMDGDVNKELFVEYKGQKVYFCCPGCEDEFNKDPEKYVSKLPQLRNNNSE